jgi:hypothetical protein
MSFGTVVQILHEVKTVVQADFAGGESSDLAGCEYCSSPLTREHAALQNLKFLPFFLFLWVIFALLDPDQPTKIKTGKHWGPKHWALIIITRISLQDKFNLLQRYPIFLIFCFFALGWAEKLRVQRRAGRGAGQRYAGEYPTLRQGASGQALQGEQAAQGQGQ